MNMYEFNQVGYSSLPALSEQELHNAGIVIKNFLSDNPSDYYMMLNNDIHYYTIYTWDVQGHRYKQMAEEILDIAKNIGEIKSIELSEDKQKVEFWIMYKEECVLFYLFDYAQGVVKV